MQEDASCTTALNIYELDGEASPLNDVLKAFYRMPIRAYDGRMSRARSSPRIPFQCRVRGSPLPAPRPGLRHAICALKLPIPW
jgi:hypothetical protein